MHYLLQNLQKTCSNMKKMLEMSEKDIQKLMQKLSANEEDTTKLNLALKNLKFCTGEFVFSCFFKLLFFFHYCNIIFHKSQIFKHKHAL